MSEHELGIMMVFVAGLFVGVLLCWLWRSP
jgi:hypothetical protein